MTTTYVKISLFVGKQLILLFTKTLLLGLNLKLELNHDFIKVRTGLSFPFTEQYDFNTNKDQTRQNHTTKKKD